MKNKFPITPVIAVDIDNTLITHGKLNNDLVDWCRHRKNDGFSLMLWSSRGMDYTKEIAEKHSLINLFDVICSKPGYVVDDVGWNWIRFTKVIRNYHVFAHFES